MNKSIYNPVNYTNDLLIIEQLHNYNTINELILKERNNEIIQLETDIELLAEIQKDLALLVDTQGESIEQIAANMENIEITVNEGTENLKKASITHKKTNKLFIGSLLTAAGVAIGGSLVAIASPLAGGIIAGSGIISGVVIIVVKAVK